MKDKIKNCPRKRDNKSEINIITCKAQEVYKNKSKKGVGKLKSDLTSRKINLTNNIQRNFFEMMIMITMTFKMISLFMQHKRK